MKKKICFFSFLLPFLSMMAIFIGNGIYPFGDQSFMHSDMYHQYVPFLEEFVRKVRDGEPLPTSVSGRTCVRATILARSPRPAPLWK